MFDASSAGHIRIPKTGELVAARLRKAIVRGELNPGDKLPSEAKLITDFEVSRPTIREAIRILEFEGLISVSRGARGGARVNPISSNLVTHAAGLALQVRGATLADIYEARAAIEPPAAQLAAQNSSGDCARALRAQLAVERAAVNDFSTFAKGVADFHRILLERCGNIALGVVGQALQDVVTQHMRLAHGHRRSAGKFDTERRRNLGLRSQERLIELIEAHDGAGAHDHWVRHMAAAGDYWLEGIRRTSVIDILE